MSHGCPLHHMCAVLYVCDGSNAENTFRCITPPSAVTIKTILLYIFRLFYFIYISQLLNQGPNSVWVSRKALRGLET